MQTALPILMYHHVSPNPGLVTVSPDVFKAQIEGLASKGWRSIGTQEVESFFAGNPLPPKSLMITFDDGYLDNFIHAHPVLAEFGMSATNFLVTSWIKDGPVRPSQAECPNHRECKRRIGAGDADSVILRWSEIELMQKAGTFEFHAHTHTHTRWDQLGLSTEDCCGALAGDLAQCQSVLLSKLGDHTRHLCWPQGYYQADYLQVAQDAGFDFLYTTEATTNRLSGNTQKIGRIVTKEKTGNWVTRRTSIYASEWQARAYSFFKQ
jgi:peptidoglycan/xylan/chitin deacetylase (PgdA/CDA1 family)